MILRLVRGHVLDDGVAAIRGSLADLWTPRVRAVEGIVRAHAGLRETPGGHEIAFVTTWTTPDAAMSVLGRDIRQVGTLAGVTEHLAGLHADHYEIDESVIRSADAEPAILRVGSGVIELGTDIEIQQELRRRLPELGDEVVEAHVGRRLHGQTVEVMLVTLWRERPDPLSLLEPIWPDIAGRYETLLVELYDIVATG